MKNNLLYIAETFPFKSKEEVELAKLLPTESFYKLISAN